MQISKSHTTFVKTAPALHLPAKLSLQISLKVVSRLRVAVWIIPTIFLQTMGDPAAAYIHNRLMPYPCDREYPVYSILATSLNSSSDNYVALKRAVYYETM